MPAWVWRDVRSVFLFFFFHAASTWLMGSQHIALRVYLGGKRALKLRAGLSQGARMHGDSHMHK